ncbi:MAG: putative multidrug ABC transporter permease protein [Acidimicrobiaceae bacterium]|nr:MAG: putative multidrug ABC transporter permease protein [Acidimicrobiaceae bacterium]
MTVAVDALPVPRRVDDDRTAFTRQVLALSKRSILAIYRQPALVAPSLIFPLFFAALGASSFDRATALPGFPQVDSFLSFSLAGSITQGVLFGSAPTSRVGILIGRLAGAAVFGAFQALFFTLVLMPFGVSVEAGVVGLMVIVLAGAATGMAIGGFTAAMALKTGSSEAVQGSFPLLFIALFFSSAFFPRETMQGVYQTIANVNPVSHLVEGLRGLVIDGLTWGNVAKAVLVPVGIGVFSIALAMRTLAGRLAAR